MDVQQLEYKAAFLVNSIVSEPIKQRLRQYPLPYNWIFTGTEPAQEESKTIVIFAITEIPKAYESRRIIEILRLIIK